MPQNDYYCDHCKTFTIITSAFKDPVKTTCAKCGNVLVWIPGKSSFILKGSGWPGKDGKVKV